MSLLKTGDLVLFASPRLWLGRLPWLRRAAWTRVGLVLRGAGDLQPLLWEVPDGLHRGATVAPLGSRIMRFPGMIGVRCLNRPLEPARCERLEALRQELCRPPERALLDLMAAADGDWSGAKRGDLADPTDAELVAAVYQRLGLLDDGEAGGWPPHRFRARHFRGGYGLELKHGYALGPELLLQEPADRHGWSDLRPEPA